VAAEAITGIVSLLTGLLSIPPLFGAGTIIDAVILLVGMLFQLLYWKHGRQRFREEQEELRTQLS